MAQAKIKINGTVGSNRDLPLSVLVALSNDGEGGESTYEWTLVDKPEGSVAAPATPSASASSFTPDLHGSYLIQLIVDKGLATEKRNRVVAGVLRPRTATRTPAAKETSEVDAARGWATDRNRAIGTLEDRVVGRGNLDICVNGSDSTITYGSAVVASGVSSRGLGIVVPSVKKANALSVATSGPVGILLGPLTADGSVASGALCRVAFGGIVAGVNLTGGAQGDVVYLGDAAGAISLDPGTVVRPIGFVVVGGANGSLYLHQGAGAENAFQAFDTVRWSLSGALSSLLSGGGGGFPIYFDREWTAPWDGEIKGVWLYRDLPGASGTTSCDVEKGMSRVAGFNSIFDAAADKPGVAPAQRAAVPSGPIGSKDFIQGETFRCAVLGIEGGTPSGISVTMVVEYKPTSYYYGS